MTTIENLELHHWDGPISDDVRQQALMALEQGKVLFFPFLDFSLTPAEKNFLIPDIAHPNAKNISYDLTLDRLKGVTCEPEQALQVKEMVKRYAEQAQTFLLHLIPDYRAHLVMGKTSFRPVEIAGRKSSIRKDDTLLHVDSFPSNPRKGTRILRLFTNINQDTKSRVWRVGEPFADVVKKMMPRASAPIKGMSHVLQFLQITKDYRTAYDHYMLQIHDAMKKDQEYQMTVPQEEIHFPPGSTWMVYTDQVSHAAMSGQHVLEQTFYLPVDGLGYPANAPLRMLEKYLNQALV